MNYLRIAVNRFVKSFCLLPLLILFAAYNASAADVTLAWDANSESDLDGYIFFYGTASGNYANSVDVGNTTQHTLTGLIEGTTYYFAAKAYDTADNESGFSEELEYTVPAPNSAPNTPAIPSGPSNGYVQTSYSYDTSGTDPDGDLLTYRFDWGDGSLSGWGGAYSRTHTFAAAATYCIRAQSQDSHAAVSPWSACLDLDIEIQTHTISASAGSTGSISPAGAVTVNHGADQLFSFDPNQNYHVADVVVDGSSVGSATTYTFENVDRDHTIEAAFARDNRLPVSNAGVDMLAWVSETVQLNGSASSDGDGDTLTYTWSFVSRPAGSTAALSDTTAVRPTFGVDVTGTYTVRLIVNDGTVDSAPDTVSISTQNSTPLANAGADQAVQVNDTVQLDGRNSSDVDGDSLSFSWSFASRPIGSTATLSDPAAVRPTFGVDGAGTYALQLIVNDGTVDSAPDTVSISTDNSAPVAAAGSDQTILVNDTVQLDGSASSDVDGDTLTYAWSLESKPVGSAAMLSVTTAVRPTFVVDVAGTYTVRLIVNDGTVDSTPETVTISTDNSAPLAAAGADQAVLVNGTVQLNGSASSDVDGDTLTYTWSFVSRPAGSTAAMSDTTAVRPTFGVDVTGTYTVRLIVNDGTVDSAPDMVSISTQNSTPLANAGADQAVLVNDTVQLDGRNSSDVDGDSLSFSWSFASRPVGSTATLSDTTAVRPTFVVDGAGTYVLQLIVNDGTVSSVPDTVTISTDNSAPVAAAGSDQAILVNDTVQLDGSASSDVDGDTLTYTWSLVSKPVGSTAALSDPTAVRPTFVVDVAGTYTAQLIVNDAMVSSAPHTVTISTDNSAPVAAAGADQAVMVNDTVQLDGSASSDADGDILVFTWSFGSRAVGSTAALSDTAAVRPTFEVDVAGTYTLQLIVSDGRVNSTPHTVTISTENSAPVSDAGTAQVVRVNDTVRLDGSGSSDADGDSLTFTWSLLSKPRASNTTLSGITAVRPTFVVDVAGTFTVQLIVNDGTDNSTPNTVTIVSENSAPASNAGNDQSAEEGELVTLNGLNSTDPDNNIAGYAWEQTNGTLVTLLNSNEAEATFTAPNVTPDSEMLTFQLTVRDSDGLQDIDSCVVTVTRAAVTDSDGDGVPDTQDAFPYDPDETLDTDGDGEGNNVDVDDDNDGMPDSWEITYGLDPLKDDAAADPDGDGISNINEYNLGTEPDHYEANLKPAAPVVPSPINSATVSLTPVLEAGEFSDPNINDVHSKTQWKITRAFDNSCVFDVTTDVALTSMTIPKQILEKDTEYIWQARFIDNHKTPSDWSENREFITDLDSKDKDGNGVPDFQEVSDKLDLDQDGTTDIDQADIKCVSAEAGTAQVCISIRDAENVVSIVSLAVEDPNSLQLVSQSKGKPNYFEFGMLDFKLLVNSPGDETTVTIYLSKRAYKDGNCFKYDPVNDAWLNYSSHTKFSPNRKEVYLTLKDGGFGDADGIENGIIVDPLAFGSESDPSSGSSESPIEELVDSVTCFISTTADQSSYDSDRTANAWYRKFFYGFIAILMLPFCLYILKNHYSQPRKSVNKALQGQIHR